MRDVAGAIFLPTQHFPLVATLDDLSIVTMDFLVVFAVALFLVSWRIPWIPRLRRFGMVLLAVFPLHVVAAILAVRVKSAEELLQQQQLRVLLPWEFQLADRLKFLLYDLGLQLGPFVLMVLTAVWNGTARSPSTTPRVGSRAASLAPPTSSPRATRASRRSMPRQAPTRSAGRARAGRLEPGPPAESNGGRTPRGRWLPAPDRRTWRRYGAAFAISVVLLASTAAFYLRWRESHPLHVGAHARLGQIYAEHGSMDAAARQYRTALAGGTTDPAVYYNLAEIVRRSGNRAEAERLLRDGQRLSGDDAWQKRFAEAVARIADSRR